MTAHARPPDVDHAALEGCKALVLCTSAISCLLSRFRHRACLALREHVSSWNYF